MVQVTRTAHLSGNFRGSKANGTHRGRASDDLNPQGGHRSRALPPDPAPYCEGTGSRQHRNPVE